MGVRGHGGAWAWWCAGALWCQGHCARGVCCQGTSVPCGLGGVMLRWALSAPSLLLVRARAGNGTPCRGLGPLLPASSTIGAPRPPRPVAPSDIKNAAHGTAPGVLPQVPQEQLPVQGHCARAEEHRAAHGGQGARRRLFVCVRVWVEGGGGLGPRAVGSLGTGGWRAPVRCAGRGRAGGGIRFIRSLLSAGDSAWGTRPWSTPHISGMLLTRVRLASASYPPSAFSLHLDLRLDLRPHSRTAPPQPTRTHHPNPARPQAATAKDPMCRLFARMCLAGLPRGGGNGTRPAAGHAAPAALPSAPLLPAPARTAGVARPGQDMFDRALPHLAAARRTTPHCVMPACPWTARCARCSPQATPSATAFWTSCAPTASGRATAR